MIIYLLKFIHVIAALSILGLSIICFILIDKKNLITFANKIILSFTVFAILTGTFLIYPKNFTFHTPWIQAAYLLTTIIACVMLWFIYFKNHLKDRWLGRIVYFVLILILIFVVHDAVTKTTFIYHH